MILSQTRIVDIFTYFTHEKMPENNFYHKHFSVANIYHWTNIRIHLTSCNFIFEMICSIEIIVLTSCVINSQKKLFFFSKERSEIFFMFHKYILLIHLNLFFVKIRLLFLLQFLIARETELFGIRSCIKFF